MGYLEDYVIIVTGSASGIGLVTSTIALTEGARVLGVDISPAPNSILENASFKFVQCDLCHESAPDQIIEACTEAFGRRVDGLLNIAGVMDLNQSVDTVSDAMWERCIAINLTAPMKLMRAVIPIMREQRSGSIVNVCSKAAMSGAVSGVAYTASKHGLIGATKNVAFRFKHENIRCNAVCPGGVAGTSIIQSVDTNCMDREATATMSLIHQVQSSDHEKGMGVHPEDIANALLFLISSRSRSTNGAVIPIDNAWSTI